NPSVTNVPSMISESTWFFEQPRLTKPIVVFLPPERDVVTNREAIGGSLRDGRKACQSTVSSGCGSAAILTQANSVLCHAQYLHVCVSCMLSGDIPRGAALPYSL